MTKMKDFNIEVKLIDDDNWYCVTDVGFRFWKNHPSDGINYIKILKDIEDGITETENIYIDDIRFTIFD